MARILICHVPKDGTTARELGGALMGRGHFVSFDGEPEAPRADRFARLRQFEAVVVVWTEASYQSAGLAQIARETLPLNLLVSVRSETLDIGRLPLAFRKLNMFAPRDFDGLARLVSRLSTAATSLKEIAEHTAKFEAEPRRELPPVVPKPPRKLEPPQLPAEPAVVSPPASYSPSAASPSAAAKTHTPLPPPIISAAHAQRTVRTPVHFELPDVTDVGEMHMSQTEAASRPQRPAIFAKPTKTVAVAKPVHQSTVAMPHPLVPPQFAPHVPAPSPATHPTTQMQQRSAAQPPKMQNAERHDAPPVPAPQPEPPSPYSAIANAQDLSSAVEAGLLLHYIPEMMWLGEPGTVEVRLDRNVLEEYFGRADAESGASVVESLSLSLYGTAEAFEIERLSERTQIVGGNSGAPEGLDRWVWHVTPHTPGRQDLVVRVSALLLDSHGVPAPVALPDRRFRVDVDAREGARVMSSLSGWVRR